jgi:predicted nucleotidyltransferase
MALSTLDLPIPAIAELCRMFQVRELAVFGSYLRDDFSPESDLDFLVLFENDDAGEWGEKFDLLQSDLARLLGREVDVVDKRAVEQSQNTIRREHILDTAQTIYVA